MANKKKDSEWASWGLIVFLFIIGLSPIALILLLVVGYLRYGHKLKRLFRRKRSGSDRRRRRSR